jgi:NAD kinase
LNSLSFYNSYLKDELGLKVLVEPETTEELTHLHGFDEQRPLEQQVDIVISLGGDG